jgi:hypothetical protein
VWTQPGCERRRFAILAATPCSGLMPETARSRHPGCSAGAPAHGARPGWRTLLSRRRTRGPLQDRRDDRQRPGATARAALQVDVEHALEPLRPADGLRPRLHGLRVAADLACGADSRFASRRTPNSRPLRQHPCPQRRVGRQHPVEPDQVQLRLWNQCRQPLQELQRARHQHRRNRHRPHAGIGDVPPMS